MNYLIYEEIQVNIQEKYALMAQAGVNKFFPEKLYNLGQ